MAEEKRSIEISYKADLKDLITKLKTLPDVTSAEAKKMVAALDRQVKQAEKASKKSAAASTKAAKASSKAAKAGSADFSALDKAGSAAAESLDEVADSAGDADRGFSAIALGLREINPALGEAAEKGADFAAVGEGLLKGFRSLNPWVLAAAAAAALLTFAWMQNQAAVEKARQAAIDYRLAIKTLEQEQAALNRTITSAKSILAGQITGYMELTGQITKYEAALIRTKGNIDQQYEGQLSAVDEIIKKSQEEIELIKILRQNNRALSESELDRLRTLQLQSRHTKKTIDLSKNDIHALGELLTIQKDLNDRIKEQEKNRQGIINLRRKSMAISETALEHEKEMAEETASAAAAAEAAAKRKAAAESRSARSAEEEAAALARALELDGMRVEMKSKLLELTGTEAEKITARYDAEFKRMGELAIETRDFETFKQISQALYEDRAEEFHDLEMKRIQARNAAVKDGAQMLVSSVDTFARASIDYLRNTDKATEESLQKLHKLQQAAAVANIAMQTAENIVKAMGMGAAAPILIAAAVAAGAAQTAAVLSSQPPTLHMGGMAPDERSTVLTGEAVLDRTTTRRIGEEGVRGLQNRTGGGAAEVIVLQPFKHFDRYNRSARRRAGRRAGSGGY